MAMKEGDLEIVASSIRRLRIEVLNDPDQSYSADGPLVLDRLTEQLADDFAAQYLFFRREAFLKASQVSQGSDRMYTVLCNMPGGVPEHDPCSFKRFEEAKSAMAEELDHHAGFHAQPESESPVRNIIKAIQAHLYNARGPEWYHSDGSCEFRIVQSEA
jgi:hypothetical protein